MRYAVLAKALLIAFVMTLVIGEEAEMNKEQSTFDADWCVRKVQLTATFNIQRFSNGFSRIDG